jgi:acyl-CoA thioester hydrolase
VLQEKTEIVIRFNEADPLGIVWHGHYIRYFEDGREAFGKKYEVTYLDFYRNNLVVPVVSVQCDYKKPLRYGQSVIVESTYHDVPAAKIKFTYRITEADSGDLVAVGSSVQVFVDAKTFQLHLNVPPFFVAWKKKWMSL